jgi:hypothetical protein
MRVRIESESIKPEEIRGAESGSSLPTISTTT